MSKSGPIETPEYGRFASRIVRAYGRRVADADEVDLAQMLKLRDELDAAIVAAVHGQRTKWQRSWGYIAEGAGITRQAAQQRWGKAVAELAARLAQPEEPPQCRADGCTREPVKDDNLCDEHKAEMIRKYTVTYPERPGELARRNAQQAADMTSAGTGPFADRAVRLSATEAAMLNAQMT